MPSAFAWPRPILLTPAYLDFVREPLGAIRRYIETGRAETAEVYAARIEESRQLMAFQKSELYQTALHDVAAGNLDAAVSSVGSLLDELYLRFDQPGAKVDDIAHWTDRLTIDLVKLKRYRDALAWIDRFNKQRCARTCSNLPSQLEAIEKRRLRCEQNLANDAGSPHVDGSR